MKTKIYIAGLPRGGTTLLSMILGQHPLIKEMGESMYAAMVNPNRLTCSCGKSPCQFLQDIYNKAKHVPEIRELYETYGIIDLIREPHKIAHRFTIQCKHMDHSDKDLRDKIIRSCNGLDSLVNIFKEVYGDYIFVDNTKEIFFAEELLNIENWKVVLITRDPRGMAWSSKKSGIRKKVPRPVTSKINVYKDFAKRAYDLKHHSNVFHLTYESLCHSPSIVVKNLCDFIGISFDLRMINLHGSREHTLFGNRMRYELDNSIIEDLSWINNLTQYERELISKNNELVCYYKQLGYDLNE